MDINLNSKLQIPSETVIKWMDAIRSADDVDQQYRVLENFWGSQIRSKSWLVNVVNEYFPTINGNVYIFGGWYGVLAELLNIGANCSKNIYSIDSDFECLRYGHSIVSDSQKIIFKVMRMEKFHKYSDAALIINTSTEHITREIYDEWSKKIPHDVPVVLQGNNLFDCDDHIRCSNNLDEFNKINPLKRIIYSGELPCDHHFKRYMTIGYINE
jgi:hypothetical protein